MPAMLTPKNRTLTSCASPRNAWALSGTTVIRRARTKPVSENRMTKVAAVGRPTASIQLATWMLRIAPLSGPPTRL